MMKQVLFVCIHNSARSQMAEAFLNQLCSNHFHAQSAGIEPGNLNNIVVQAMREIELDISNNKTKSVDSMIDSKQTFDYVITVCDETNAERCPVFPEGVTKIHWNFTDPSSLQGTNDEKLSKTRKIRDEIKNKIISWCKENCQEKNNER